MIEDIEIADNVIGRRMAGGKIEQRDMERLVNEVERKLRKTAHLRVYVEYESFGGISAAGLLKDIQLGLKHFRAFEKKAVVTDKPWTGKVAAVADRLFPTIQLRTFPTSERDAARTWVQS